VEVALTLRKVAALAKDGHEALDGRVFTRPRRLFEDYRDTDVISMDLRQAANVDNPWDMEKFCRVFGCSKDAASRLLRELGYVPDRDDSYRRTWRDPSL
jgi:AraC-like DNA-binding protein